MERYIFIGVGIIKKNYEETYIKKVMKLKGILAILSIRFPVFYYEINLNERNTCLIKLDKLKVSIIPNC